MIPVSHYEALLAEVRGLRRKAQRVQRLATPFLQHCSTTSLLIQNDRLRRSFKMETVPTSNSTNISISSEPTSNVNLHTLQNGSMWNSEPVPQSSSMIDSNNLPEATSVMSFTSSSGVALLTTPNLSRRSSQQSDTKIDIVYSLLSMLSGQEHADMGETLLALSTNPESCLAMRQSGCIPLLIQMIHSDREAESRFKASQAVQNLINCQIDEKARKRESRVYKLLETTRNYCELEVTSLYDDDKHPIQTVAHLMKLSFDELHRQAICTFGGITTIAKLVENEHLNHGSCEILQPCILLRRYACMALTNLTFGDSGNKALLCSFRDFMRALVIQLQSLSDELRQVTASVLRNLSWRADTTSKEILKEVGSVTGLMKAAMLDNKENTLKSILSALWNLSAHCTENKSEICSVDGALAFLVESLNLKTPAIIENAGGILRNISSQIAVRDDYREILRQHNCLQILLKQLKSPSLTIVSNACGTLWNLSAKDRTDQDALWELGAPAMLRNLNHSKHKMIAMGSSAALKNLIAAKPSENLTNLLDTTAISMDLPVLPTLNVRKQKALLHELDLKFNRTTDNEGYEYDLDFNSLTIGEASSSGSKNSSLPYFNSNDLNRNCFLKKKSNDNRSFNLYSDSGLQSLDSASSIDNEKEIASVCSDEKDRCSIEEDDSDSSFLSNGLTVRRDVAHCSSLAATPPTLSKPKLKYPNLTASNVTMFEGNIDEIDMDDISIHFTCEDEKKDTEKLQDTKNLPKAANKASSIPLPQSQPESPIRKCNKTSISRLSSCLPRRLTTSTPIKPLKETIQSKKTDDDQTSQYSELILNDIDLPNVDLLATNLNDMLKTGETTSYPSYHLSPESRDRLLERSCEENNPVDNRMLDPDAMIESLERFTAELVSQASHLQKSDKENNTWNEDTSVMTFPSISGSPPNVITFDNSKMSESALIAIEASKIASVFKNDTEMFNSLELDQIQPPSILGIICSPKLIARKSLTKNFIAKRALNLNSSNDSLSNLDQVNPPSLMGEIFDIDLSLNEVNPPTLFNEITDLCNSLADIPTESEIFEDCQTHIDDDITEFSDAISDGALSPKRRGGIPRAMTLKQRRNQTRDRYKTYTIAAEMLIDAEKTECFNGQSNIRKKFVQKRLENRERFQTQVVEGSLELQQLVQAGEQNAVGTSTSHVGSAKVETSSSSSCLSLKQTPPSSPVKPKIVKPQAIKPLPNSETTQPKSIRGRRKPLYSKAPITKSPLKTTVKNVAKTSISGRTMTNPKPPLERQGTFTMDEKLPSSKSRIPTSRIPSAVPTFSKPKVAYGRSTSADNTKKATPTTSNVKRASISASSKSASSGNLNNSKKQVTSKIASLWKKIEETKNKPTKKDSRVWIGGAQGGEEQEAVVLRRKPKVDNEEEKRVSRLGSFIIMDEAGGTA